APGRAGEAYPQDRPPKGARERGDQRPGARRVDATEEVERDVEVRRGHGPAAHRGLERLAAGRELLAQVVRQVERDEQAVVGAKRIGHGSRVRRALRAGLWRTCRM